MGRKHLEEKPNGNTTINEVQNDVNCHRCPWLFGAHFAQAICNLSPMGKVSPTCLLSCLRHAWVPHLILNLFVRGIVRAKQPGTNRWNLLGFSAIEWTQVDSARIEPTQTPPLLLEIAWGYQVNWNEPRLNGKRRIPSVAPTLLINN